MDTASDQLTVSITLLIPSTPSGSARFKWRTLFSVYSHPLPPSASGRPLSMPLNLSRRLPHTGAPDGQGSCLHFPLPWRKEGGSENDHQLEEVPLALGVPGGKETAILVVMAASGGSASSACHQSYSGRKKKTQEAAEQSTGWHPCPALGRGEGMSGRSGSYQLCL